jgi:uncharacterized membrane protein
VGRKNQSLTHIQAKLETHSGPLPPPAVLAGYDQIVPGSAERIIAMSERQSEHRQSLEKQVINSDIRQAWGGMLCALVIALAGLAVAAYCTINGHDQVGGIIGGATIVSLVGTFVYGTAQRKKEKQNPPQR